MLQLFVTEVVVISALVMRKLFYCSTVWSNTVNNIKTLQGAQNFACRIITGTRKFDHITLALQELNWPPIKQLLLDRDSITTFKCMKGLAPSYLRATDQKYRESDDRIVISYFGFFPQNVYVVNYFQKSHF